VRRYPTHFGIEDNVQKKLSTLFYLTSVCLIGGLQTGCSIGGAIGSGTPPQAAIAAYCPYLPSRTFSSPVTVSGSAFYEYRINGNGPVSDSVHTLTPSVATNGTSYSLTINGTAKSFTCNQGSCSASYAVSQLTSVINADSSLPVSASGTSTLVLTPKNEGPAITLSALSGNLTDTTDNGYVHTNPNPIRYAEIQVTNSQGSVVQCAETDASGAFSFQLPSDGATYTVSVWSRANNSHNTAYIMNNPTDNVPYKVSKPLTASGTPSVVLLAKATGDLLGGAFNILDQVYNAQNYLRTQTANCNNPASSNYFFDCDPFVSAPIVNTYWTPGLTPAVYEGGTGGLSFFGTPNGYESFRGLYILGGINGDTDNSDMDHFDNSVIVHEYGHFIEYNFGRMDSPGGSHNGNSIVDSRLAWGEGWADFFQGVVLGTGVYRDTYGHVGCTGSNSQNLPGCTGIAFNDDLNANPSSCSYPTCTDIATAVGEGNFREFSVARILYQAAKVGGTSQFSEVWTIVHGPTQGMKAIADRFKGISRFHKLEQALSGSTLWATLRTTEKQAGDMSGYNTPFVSNTCSSTNQPMAIYWTALDSGSFADSDQFRNNDFIAYNHPGGSLSIHLSWSGTGQADLDLYVYGVGYVYGDNSSIVASSNQTVLGTTGSEAISTTLPAGQYLINVMAYTGSYSSPGTYNTTYNLTVNGAPVCLTP
jgi:Fungalysin metallopeptidase (M36)